MIIVIGGVIAAVIIAVFVLFAFVLYSRGKVVRVLADTVVSYFVGMTNDRFMRLTFKSKLVRNLTPALELILDELVFTEKPIEGEEGKTEKVRNDVVTEELFKWWLHVKNNKSDFQIWCYKFQRRWKYFGITGTTVYAFCPYPLEEMIKHFSRRDHLFGEWLPKPVHIHAQNMEEWTTAQIAKFKNNELSAKMLETINKSYSFWGEATYLATMFFPTALTVSQGRGFSDKIASMGNILKLLLLKTNDVSKLADYDLIKQIADSWIEQRRQLEIKLNSLGDVIGRKSAAFQDLEVVVKDFKIPVKNSTTIDSLPSFRPTQQKSGPVFSVAKKVKEKAKFHPVETISWIMILLGLPLSIIGVIGVAFSNAPLSLPLLGVLVLVIGAVMMYLYHKNDPKPKVVKKAEVDVNE